MYNLNLAYLPLANIFTLGPAGTSSEAAAEHLIAHMRQYSLCQEGAVSLSDSYEDAKDRLLDAKSGMLVVANAYANVNAFYMDNLLNLAATFVFDTPLYGIACQRGASLPSDLVIATHPAPTPLIYQLLPEHLGIRQIVYRLSTSTSARAVAEGEVHAALTNAKAAKAYGLEFISTTRAIRMLWSVFTKAVTSTERPERRPVAGSRLEVAFP